MKIKTLSVLCVLGMVLTTPLRASDDVNPLIKVANTFKSIVNIFSDWSVAHEAELDKQRFLPTVAVLRAEIEDLHRDKSRLDDNAGQAIADQSNPSRLSADVALINRNIKSLERRVNSLFDAIKDVQKTSGFTNALKDSDGHPISDDALRQMLSIALQKSTVLIRAQSQIQDLSHLTPEKKKKALMELKTLTTQSKELTGKMVTEVTDFYNAVYAAAP